MLKYSDGSEIQVGDAVLLEHGNTSGIVEIIVSTPEEMRAIGVEEPGVMLRSRPFGRVYLPLLSLAEDPLQFVARAASS